MICCIAHIFPIFVGLGCGIALLVSQLPSIVTFVVFLEQCVNLSNTILHLAQLPVPGGKLILVFYIV